VVSPVYVFGDFVRSDVPATAFVVAGRRLIVAAVAQKRPSQEELFETGAILRRQPGVLRARDQPGEPPRAWQPRRCRERARVTGVTGVAAGGYSACCAPRKCGA